MRPIHLHKQIRQGRYKRQPLRCHMEIAKQVIMQGSAMRLVIFIHKFIFQLRHIHSARTFRSATLASQAEIKGRISCRFQFRPLRFLIPYSRPDQGPQKICPAPGRIRLVARRLKGRTHHARILPAHSLAITVLDCSSQAALMLKM